MDDKQTEAGEAWEDIAASAYRAYAASVGNRNFRGEPMPAFSALPQAIQTAWEVAVRQAGDIHQFGSKAYAWEEQWAGWIPPHLRERRFTKPR